MLMKMVRNRNGGMISYLCALELMLKVISQPSLFIVLGGAQRIFPESSTTSLSYISFIFINSNVHILLLSTQVFFFLWKEYTNTNIVSFTTFWYRIISKSDMCFQITVRISPQWIRTILLISYDLHPQIYHSENQI